MLGTQDLGVFLIAGLLVNLMPGVDTLYVISRATTQGVRAGIVGALGIASGSLVHTTAAAIGLSAIVAATSMGFTLVKVLGGVYLVFIGISMIIARHSADVAPAKRKPAALPTVFWQGFLTNVLNPKVAIFFLAFLPQFISADAENKWFSMMFLGLVFTLNGTLWIFFVAWSSASVADRLSPPQHIRRFGRWLMGGLFVFFGVKLLRSQI